MSDILAEYQKWKQQGADLKSQAKAAIEGRFRAALLEAVQLAEDYKSDFGGVLKPPPVVTSFRFKSGVKPKAKAKPAAAVKQVAAKAIAAPKVEAKPDPKVIALEKKLGVARKKLDAAKSAGTPTKNLEDRVYEIEDDLRLAKG